MSPMPATRKACPLGAPSDPVTAENRLLCRLLAEQRRVVELAPVRENVRVGVGCEAELALPDEAGDLCPCPSLPVQKRDSAVAQVVRGEHRHPGRFARPRNRDPEAIGTETRRNSDASRSRSSRGGSVDSTASASTSGSSTQSAARVFVVDARRRTRLLGSS